MAPVSSKQVTESYTLTLLGDGEVVGENFCHICARVYNMALDCKLALFYTQRGHVIPDADIC